MEEVQSWWEVPAISHFCYVFRSAFNLFFFEIAELESALLNIQDPDMSISLEQLIIKLLEGCCDEGSVTEENWEEKLRELFKDNLEDDENPINSEAYFYQFSPRMKVEVLFKLCELRLDVEDVLEEIKNIPPEDMQAKCIGKDSQNNIYWYFCDERLYKENPSSGNKTKELKNAKNASNIKSPLKNAATKRQSTRERKSKVDVNKPWAIECLNLSDWEKFMQKFTKSKSAHEKELCASIKKHLPLLQEKVAEKDRMLRKRFLELAPKRTSSRISRVQEKKKMEELKAAEEARLAKMEAEKERAKKEAEMLKMQKESRQRRIEERRKAIEERAGRVKLRDLARSENNNSDDYSDDDNEDDRNDQDVPDGSDKDWDTAKKIRKIMPSTSQRAKRNVKSIYQKNADKESSNSGSKIKSTINSRQSTDMRTAMTKLNIELTQPDRRRYIHTYSNYKRQSTSVDSRTSTNLQSDTKVVKYHYESDESEQTSNSVSSTNGVNMNYGLQQATQKSRESNSEEGDSESSRNADHSSGNTSEIDARSSRNVKENFVSKHDLCTLSSTHSSGSQDIGKNNLPSKYTVYKTVLQNTSDVAKWNAALDSKGQKLHILHRTYDNLASKRFKLEQVNFKSVSPIMKSSLSKENQVYKPVQKTAFITFGKIIPSSSIVKLEYRKPSNPQVSS